MEAEVGLLLWGHCAVLCDQESHQVKVFLAPALVQLRLPHRDRIMPMY